MLVPGTLEEYGRIVAQFYLILASDCLPGSFSAWFISSEDNNQVSGGLEALTSVSPLPSGGLW